MNHPNQTQPGLLNRLFFTPGERRLRTLWRLLGLLLLLLGLTLLFAILLGGLLFLNLTPEANLLVQQAIAASAITASVFLARRWLDRRSTRSLGLAWDRLAVQDLLVGAAVPGLMMGMVFLLEWGLGWIKLEGVAWQTRSPEQILVSLLLLLGMFILVGWGEELFSRGYFLQNLADGFNLFWGVLLSSVGFAALHYANPSFNLSALPFLGLVLAGLFLAFGWLRTRQLWLPIGLHIGWNFFEGPVFGFPVSGLDIPRLLLHRETGPDLFTGGPFGPEAGLILLPALAVGALLVYVYTRGRVSEEGERG